MDLVRRAAQLEVKGPPVVKRAEEEVEDTDFLATRDANESWRRLVLRALVVTQAARFTVLASEFRELGLKKASDKSKIDVQDLSGRVAVPRVQIILRTPLTLSKSVKQMAMMPDECDHQWLMPRGGKTYWFACRMCPMRWPRQEGEYCQEEDSVPPGTLSRRGR